MIHACAERLQQGGGGEELVALHSEAVANLVVKLSSNHQGCRAFVGHLVNICTQCNNGFARGDALSKDRSDQWRQATCNKQREV